MEGGSATRTAESNTTRISGDVSSIKDLAKNYMVVRATITRLSFSYRRYSSSSPIFYVRFPHNSNTQSKTMANFNAAASAKSATTEDFDLTPRFLHQLHPGLFYAGIADYGSSLDYGTFDFSGVGVYITGGTCYVDDIYCTITFEGKFYIGDN